MNKGDVSEVQKRCATRDRQTNGLDRHRIIPVFANDKPRIDICESLLWGDCPVSDASWVFKSLSPVTTAACACRGRDGQNSWEQGFNSAVER